ncbi:hypothetical protein [Halosimplex halobium]|uniref:hypothetical protein n=1 Tax=Halosimplex halobium TaxID=3396618 RepID=UPI003F5491CA
MSFRDPSGDTCSTASKPEGQHNSGPTGDYPVSGIVNRVKVPDINERRAVVNDPSIDTVMLSIESARKLVDIHRETANTYFREDQTVITTTTVHDDTLKELGWLDELDIVRRFGPDYHIPTEYSVYQSPMSPEVQENAISDCMDGTEWFDKRLENHSTAVLVQAKGWLPWHFELCRPTMERLGTDFLVFYATGYKARVEELKRDLEALISVLHPSGILIIGKQSTRFLSQAPPEIVAAAGGRWRRKSGLEENRHNSKRHKNWKVNVEQDLGSGQAILNSYNSTKVKENG